MKTKFLFMTALGALVLASCADDGFVGDENAKKSGEGAISFDLRNPSATRADKTGAAAATDLNEQFYVYAIKNESTDGAGNVGAGNLVFKNYIVKWADNSAYTTTSNTKNWEYVGYTLSEKERANVTANSGNVAQTIKYWDYAANDYTFYAFSALPTDISTDKVSVEKVQDQKTTDEPAHNVYDNGYTVTLAAGADLDHLFFAERTVITKSAGTDRNASNAYGGNVTFRFHNMASKVRVAMYETIPGHTVTINKFSVDNDGANPAFGDMEDDVTANFAANLQNCASGVAGTMTVKYVSSGTNVNHPTTSFTGTKAKVLNLGTGLKENITIGESVTDATYDKALKAYTSVFPNETNAQNLKLKLTYTLTAPVTGETTVISNKTAEVPAAYLQWKPGYAYTYIFKITDDALYPITFDAVEVISEDGKAEYITTVSEPSITTFGVSGGKYVTGGSDYAAGTVVYATVMDGSSLATLSASNMNLYTVTATSPFDITEASVAEALIEKPTMTKAQVDLAKVVPAASSFTGYTKTVPGEDGVNIDLDPSAAKAAYFTTVTDKKYAIVYQKDGAAPTYVWGTGSTCDNQAALDALKAASVDGKLYTDDQCTVEASYTWADAVTVYYTPNAAKYASDGDFTDAGNVYAAPGSVATPAASRTDGNTPYYKPIKVKSKGTVVVKVVTCP